MTTARFVLVLLAVLARGSGSHSGITSASGSYSGITSATAHSDVASGDSSVNGTGSYLYVEASSNYPDVTRCSTRICT